MRTTYYEAFLNITGVGITVGFTTYECIHETPTYAYCVPSWNSGYSSLKAARAAGVKIFRAHKTCSRKLFDSKEGAFNQLKLRKRYHEKHMRRSLEIISAFNNAAENLKFSDLDHRSLNTSVVPGTDEVVNRHYTFEY